MAKKKRDVRLVRFNRVVKKIKWWEARKRRADNALRKLARQKKYYEREQLRPIKETVADLRGYGFDDDEITKLVAVGGASCR